MEPETEELLKKWLKIQIFQYKLGMIKLVIMILFFIFTAWSFYSFLLPVLSKQVKNTQTILENVNTVSEDVKEKEELLKDFDFFQK